MNLTGLCTKASQTFCGTFSGTLLNVTWLRTKASHTFSGTFGTFPTFPGTSLNLTRRLHQCTPELFWAEDPISSRCCGKRDELGWEEMRKLESCWKEVRPLRRVETWEELRRVEKSLPQLTKTETRRGRIHRTELRRCGASLHIL